MGLDTSHGCWHGPYSQFMRWREWVASQAGIPLHLMEGFYGWTWDADDLPTEALTPVWEAAKRVGDNGECWWDTLRAVQKFGKAIPWSIVADKPLVVLLHHSDCGGRIRLADCLPLARRLGTLLRSVPDDTKYPTHSNGPQAGQLIWSDWRGGRGCYDGMVPATKRFIRGLLEANRLGEDVLFR